MAEVPVFNGGQVLQVGSPVAALSGKSGQELLGDAISELGDAGQKLFTELIRQDTIEASQKVKNDVTLASEGIKQIYIAAEAEAKQAAIDDKTEASGVGIADTYMRAAEKKVAEYLQQYKSPQVIEEALIDSSSTKTLSYKNMIANGAESVALYNKATFEGTLSMYQKSIERDPRNFSDAITNQMIKTNESKNLTFAQKVEQHQRNYEASVQAAVSGFISRGSFLADGTHKYQKQEFEAGLKWLETHASQLPPKLMADYRKQLVQARSDMMRDSNAIQDQHIQIKDREEKRYAEEVQNGYIKSFNEAYKSGDMKQVQILRDSVARERAFIHEPSMRTAMINYKPDMINDDDLDLKVNEMLTNPVYVKNTRAVRDIINSSVATTEAKARNMAKLRAAEDGNSTSEMRTLNTQVLGYLNSFSKLQQGKFDDSFVRETMVEYSSKVAAKVASGTSLSRASRDSLTEVMKKHYVGYPIPNFSSNGSIKGTAFAASSRYSGMSKETLKRFNDADKELVKAIQSGNVGEIKRLTVLAKQRNQEKIDQAKRELARRQSGSSYGSQPSNEGPVPIIRKRDR